METAVKYMYVQGMFGALRSVNYLMEGKTLVI